MNTLQPVERYAGIIRKLNIFQIRKEAQIFLGGPMLPRMSSLEEVISPSFSRHIQDFIYLFVKLFVFPHDLTSEIFPRKK